MKDFDKASANVKDIRQAMNGRIGEIISAVVGDDTLQKIFEQPEHHKAYIEANQKGTPSGLIALDLGIVDQDVKNALLVAQAAERMARNAAQAQDVRAGAVDAKSLVKQTVGIHDDVFKFVGSARDPQDLQEAQAGWQISQIWLNETLHEAVRNSRDGSYRNSVYTMEGPGEDFSGGLLKAAAGYYKAAAATLESKGFADAGTKLRAAAADVEPVNAAAIKTVPFDVANTFLEGERRYRQDMMIALGSDHYTSSTNEDLGIKLCRLTMGQKDDPGPAAKPAPKGGPNR